MHTITRYLESLKDTHDGDELRGLIQRVLRRHGATHAIPDSACLIELHRQLQLYADDPITLPNMRIRARLLQQHIAPYLPEADAPSTGESAGNSAAPEPALRLVSSAREAPADASDGGRTERYRTLQRSEQDAWQAIYGTVKDYQKLKQAWMKSLDELAQQREALEVKLTKTTEELSLLQAEHDRLRSELDKARREPKRIRATPRLLPRHSKGLNGLPKRDVFVRNLETEIKRIKRSGAPLALGLIGIERLDAIGEQHGSEASEAALRCYAQEILASFRAYDLVTLYERDQFAVLFPDTRKEGAQRALEKAYKRAAETHVVHNGASFPLPPFAGTLALYSTGEDPGTFLERAQQALEDARRSGNTGVVLA